MNATSRNETVKILMISSTFPYPPSRSGTEVRTFNLLKYLHDRHDITVATQRQGVVTDAEVAELRKWVKDLKIFAMRAEPQSQGNLKNWLSKGERFISSAVKGTPPNVLHRYSSDMQAWIDEQVKEGKCDVVTCEHSVNAIYIRPDFTSSVKTVVNVHSSVYGGSRDHLQAGASENALRDRLYLSILYRYEKDYSDLFSDIVVTTEHDRRQLININPEAKITVIPNGVDLELFPYSRENTGGHKLVFVGAMDLSHNIDAAKFFASEVMPVLQQSYQDATFTIVGTRPTPEIQALGELPGIKVTGRVPSVAEYLHESTVCVIPLRAGIGIKNKTLEAMAAGTPVVGSDRALEGLSVDGGDVPVRALRANRIEEYIVTISRLFTDPALRKRLSGNAREFVEREYTWERAGEAYEQVLLS